MSGFIEEEVRSVKIVHHSVSSTIEVLISNNEEVKQGKVEKVTTKVWLDYGTFEDLKEVINKIDF